jgi:O-antigen ligase
MNARANRYLLPLAFALAPAAMLVLTWQDSASVEARALRLYLPVVLSVEILVICVALLDGLRPAIPRSALIVLLALFTVAWGAAAFAPEPGRSLIWTGIWMIHLGFGWAAGRLFDAKAAANTLMAGFLLFTGLLAVRATTPVEDWLSNPPGLDQIRRYAYYAAPIAGLAVGALAGSRRLYPFIVASAAFAMIFWNGARGAVLAILVATAAAMWIFPALRGRTVAALSLASAALGFVVSLALPSQFSVMGTARMLNASSSGRDWVWRRISEVILERPVFGWGEAQASVFTGFAQPHNLPLQLLLAWGVVGTALVAYLGVTAARPAISAIAADDRLLPAAVATLTLLAYSLVDGTLYHVLPAAIFAAMIGIILHRAGELRSASEARGNVSASGSVA